MNRTIAGARENESSGYRVEVSGWDLEERFFVEKSTLVWSERSGKTVALKTTGMAALAAQSGIPVAAQRAVLPLFDRVLVDIGDEVRQVLAGIAPSYAPEELVGRKVVVVTNLAPRKMRGVESNGMLLAASAGPDGKAVLCTFAEEIPAGAKVK